MRNLFLTNTLTRRKELFVPIHPGHVGMYVCGPTVYGDAHLGHARPGVTYDVLFRLLKHLGYKVRYVRNITDVGHLEHDADEGEDKIAKKAKLEDLEPMEVVQTYTERYHEAMHHWGPLCWIISTSFATELALSRCTFYPPPFPVLASPVTNSDNQAEPLCDLASLPC